jgi:hypothetical protein
MVGRSLTLQTYASARRYLLHGPAVPVRVAEEDERAPVELLDLADLDPTLNEFGARGLYVLDYQL